MDWIAEGAKYYASDEDNQYLLQEDGAGWVVMVLEILDEGKRTRLIDLRLDASDADEAMDAAASLLGSRS
jgi:hypothetical protein